MIFKEKVQNLLNEVLLLNPSLFLITLDIDISNKISVILDGDNGVSLQDCIEVSRFIESKLDREEEDFSLEVASSGVSTPLQNIRQYKKNIGRKLKVKTISAQTIEATIVAANEEGITLEWKTKVPKKIGKGKETIDEKLVLPYQEIIEAKVIISF